MPKGDKEKLKADPEDRIIAITHLLPEAFSVAQLTGKELQAILFLIRRTYGWLINGEIQKDV